MRKILIDFLKNEELQSTPGAQRAFLLYPAGLFFCGMEVAPQFELLGLNWPNYIFYLIAMGVGAVSGMMMFQKKPICGGIGGAVAGLGGLLLFHLYGQKAPCLHVLVALMAMGFGAIPGVLVGKALNWASEVAG